METPTGRRTGESLLNTYGSHSKEVIISAVDAPFDACPGQPRKPAVYEAQYRHDPNIPGVIIAVDGREPMRPVVKGRGNHGRACIHIWTPLFIPPLEIPLVHKQSKIQQEFGRNERV